MFSPKDKNKLFPEITDWNDPHNEYRYAKVRDLDYKHWFYFHPSAYSLFAFGSPIISIIVFGITFFYLITREVRHYIIILLVVILLMSNIISLVKKIKRHYKDTTFYDIHMREYF